MRSRCAAELRDLATPSMSQNADRMPRYVEWIVGYTGATEILRLFDGQDRTWNENVQFMTNKASLLHDHFLEKGLDGMCVKETWHQPGFLCPKWSLSSKVQLPSESLQHWTWWWTGGVTPTGTATAPHSSPHFVFIWVPWFFLQAPFPFDCGAHLPTSQVQLYLFLSSKISLSPSADLIILVDLKTHVDSISSRQSAEFLQLLDTLNLIHGYSYTFQGTHTWPCHH